MSANKSRKPRSKKPRSNGGNNGRRDERQGNHGVNTIPMDQDPTPAIHNDSMLSGLSSEQIKDVGSIPWLYPAGRPQELIDPGVSTNSSIGQYSAPGIMTIDLVVGPGYSWDYWSPVNQAALNQMTFLRANNSRSDSHYQASDLILYEMAMESAFILYQHVKRAYYTVKKWDSTNRYTPDALLFSMGFDFHDFKRNLPKLRSYMDQFMYMVGSLPLPANLEIFKRHLSMFSNIYEDSSTVKAQYYLFKPLGLYIYDEWRRDLPKTETVRPGRDRFIKWDQLVAMKWYPSTSELSSGWDLDPSTESKTHLTVDDLIEIFEFIGSTLMSSDDIMKMGADIEKAYGSNVWYLDPLSRDDIIVPKHDEEVLLAIHNSRARYPLPSSLHIEQTATGLEHGDALIQWAPASNYNYNTRASFCAHNPNCIVDQWTDQPTPEMVVSATRLQANYIDIGSSSNEHPNIDCGTMFPAAYHVWVVEGDGNFHEYTCSNFYVGGVANQIIEYITKFDWHPLLFTFSYSDSTTQKLSAYHILGDLDSWTTFSRSLLKRQNEVDTIAQWKIPETAYYR